MIASSSAMNCAAHAARGLHHLVVIERLRQHAGRHVGDARDAQHLQCPCAARRSLPAPSTCRPRRRQSSAGSGSPPASRSSGRARRRRRRARSADAGARGRFVGQRAQARRVDLGHVRESAAPKRGRRSARSSGLLPEQIDVIVDQHQRALRERRVDAAGRVGEDQHLARRAARARAWRTSPCAGRALRRSARGPTARRSRACPRRRRPPGVPAWPITRGRGPVRQCRRTGSDHRRRPGVPAKSPRPEPSTTAISGSVAAARARIVAAAAFG